MDNEAKETGKGLGKGARSCQQAPCSRHRWARSHHVPPPLLWAVVRAGPCFKWMFSYQLRALSASCCPQLSKPRDLVPVGPPWGMGIPGDSPAAIASTYPMGAPSPSPYCLSLPEALVFLTSKLLLTPSQVQEPCPQPFQAPKVTSRLSSNPGISF